MSDNVMIPGIAGTVDRIRTMAEDVKASEGRISLANTSLADEEQSNAIMSKVLDNLNTLAYVISFDDYSLLFANKPLRDALGDAYSPGIPCWQVIRPDIGAPCPFCEKHKLLDEEGNPRDITNSYDIFNSLLQRWYLVSQTLIDWTDGSKAVLMTTIDITERKEMEAQLEYMASTDAATGALNRGWGMEKFEEHCGQAAKANADVSIAILDIDYMKSVNDRYGHTAGDTLIKTIAGVVKENLEEGDMLIRIGGDEFLIVFADPSHTATRQKMASISSQVSAINDKPRFPFVCSISYGIKTEKATGGNFVDSIITQADALLFEAKRTKH